MPTQSKYLLSVRMDVEPEREALFNEVYDREHLPEVLKVPGLIAAARFKKRELKMIIGGEVRTFVFEDEPKYGALYELESTEVLTSVAWAEAVEKGRWPAQVRPYTKNRRHVMYEQIGLER